MRNSIEIAKEAIQIEGNAIMTLAQQLDDHFEKVVQKILNSEGKVIVTGMGKSGLIGKKIAATLASTGTPSFFMHPGEAFHGDLGMIEEKDVVVAISNSGETDEVLKLIPFLKDNKNWVVSMTGDPQSTLAVNTNCHLNVSVDKEACPLELAPTTSTTATLVMGDALAVALMELRKFKEENFARFHPGGSLGRRLLTKALDVMKSDNLPIINPLTDMIDIIHEITNGRLGLAIVCEGDAIVGIITDGDMRRSFELKREEVFRLKAIDIMTQKPKCIKKEMMLVEVQEIMNQSKVNALLVTETGSLDGLLGVIQLFDIS